MVGEEKAKIKAIPKNPRAARRRTGAYAAKDVQENSKTKWTLKTGRLNRSTPAVVGGVVYVGSHHSHLCAVDAATGKLKWKFQTKGDLSSSPVVADGTVYFGSHDGHL